MAEQDQLPPERIEVPVEPTEPTPVEEPAWNVPVAPRRSRKVYGGMWGTPEIAAVAGGAGVFLLATLFYFAFVLPSDRELTRNKSEADRLDAELISARTKYGEITSTEEQVGKLLASVDDFQTRFLPAASNGQAALYQRLNGLILGYGLVNTTGPDYAPLDANVIGGEQETDSERGRAKFRSLFPGVYVTMTVEGSYQNLRRFIRELETGREFVVVSTVELAPSETEKKSAPNAPTTAGVQPGINPNQPFTAVQNRPKGKMHGENVSLHLELAAYFRRPDFAPMATQQ